MSCVRGVTDRAFVFLIANDEPMVCLRLLLPPAARPVRCDARTSQSFQSRIAGRHHRQATSTTTALRSPICRVPVADDGRDQWWDFGGAAGHLGVRVRLTAPPSPTAAVLYGAFAPQAGFEYTGWSGAAWFTVAVPGFAEQSSATIEHDHVTHVRGVALAALSQRTDRIRLGRLVTCAAYRQSGAISRRRRRRREDGSSSASARSTAQHQAYGFLPPAAAAHPREPPRRCGRCGPRSADRRAGTCADAYRSALQQFEV
jgi:hypothetical protein